MLVLTANSLSSLCSKSDIFKFLDSRGYAICKFTFDLIIQSRILLYNFSFLPHAIISINIVRNNEELSGLKKRKNSFAEIAIEVYFFFRH